MISAIRRFPWRTTGQLFVVASAVGTLAASQQYILGAADGNAPPFGQIVVLTLPFWYLWLLMSPVVVWLGHRVPIERRRLVRTVAWHVGFAVVLSILHSVLYVASIIITRRLAGAPELPAPVLDLLFSLSWFQLTTNLMTYGVIVGATYAVDFYRRFREREVAASTLAGQLAQARLDALRMQLNPHFLFNAMNTISMLVRKGDHAEAVRMLAGLSELLRHVLQDARPHEIRLGEEIEVVNRYLDIEKVRFGDRLRVEVSCGSDTDDALVPNLILQPLVENAVRHGIAKRAAAGLIEIAAAHKNGKLTVRVQDDGPGLCTGATDVAGVGIQNTRTRLQQLYGTDQGVTLENAPGGGAVATVTLPYHTSPVTVEQTLS